MSGILKLKGGLLENKRSLGWFTQWQHPKTLL